MAEDDLDIQTFGCDVYGSQACEKIYECYSQSLAAFIYLTRRLAFGLSLDWLVRLLTLSFTDRSGFSACAGLRWTAGLAFFRSGELLACLDLLRFVVLRTASQCLRGGLAELFFSGTRFREGTCASVSASPSSLQAAVMSFTGCWDGVWFFSHPLPLLQMTGHV